MFHLVVRIIQQESAEIQFITLDGQVTALVNHRQGLSHCRLVVHKFLHAVILPRQFVQVLV